MAKSYYAYKLAHANLQGRFAPVKLQNLKQLPEPQFSRSQDDSYVTMEISTVVGIPSHCLDSEMGSLDIL
ncbi:hypothetical protein Tco_0621545 [Tanacetum coccineum]